MAAGKTKPTIRPKVTFLNPSLMQGCQKNREQLNTGGTKDQPNMFYQITVQPN